MLHNPPQVLLCGMGADEQLGGYSRHRARFTAAGWSALLEEISLEISRIHTRNLGRDNRILSDHGRAPRFPYLDEDVVNFLNSLPVWIKANLYLPRGVGEKLVLRVAAAHLGLTAAAVLPKRAIQFGSRIAKLENSRERGSDPCVRLVEK
nr:asparagine synthetase domain-containing protein 1-like [Cherax quadricarinatus]